ncbi:hypothetical protein LOD99_12027 [Oopsacas minuta]|uniref:Ubiquitin-like protease family profile domain-containing protein n=1 Tax=Oopsacas minuta TaxID=111878 RepID=A0AAV7JHQ7_9METZ|nr:hypothetical protein LOD99_12027 [Oopsacas minuta]
MLKVKSSIFKGLNLGAPLSELSDQGTLLKETTLHAFMACLPIVSLTQTCFLKLFLIGLIMYNIEVLLRNQFPHLPGLQNIVEGRYGVFKTCPTKSLQTHKDAACVHWLVYCADKTGQVSLFDSVFDSVSDDFKVQLAEIYTQKHTFKYIMQIMQQQKEFSDCGIFVTVVFTAIAFGPLSF